MSSGHAAAHLGVSIRTITYWASSGKIPAYKQGKLWKFDRREIERIAAGAMPLPDRPRVKFPLFRLRLITRYGTQIEMEIGPTGVIIYVVLVKLVEFLLRP